MSNFPQLSRAQVLNLMQSQRSALEIDSSLILVQNYSYIVKQFEDVTELTVPHNGGRYVVATLYNTDHYQFPPARIRSIHYGLDETDPDHPFYYVHIEFHQPESGVVRITL